ncbi:GNAT family N-acetyltransferase [Aliikangiella sp. IMCC44359]|uniref:GNAT family N-acetyltransferase n=1 Tax=Aliikangiella sp. IMCC44359 TaxID=3459125 RepID=UPI00403A7CB6
MKFEVINEENVELFDELISGVRKYNHEIIGSESSIPLFVVTRDDNGKLTGGVSGRTIYKHFLISVVWVDKKLRNKGVGSLLMQRAEAEAKKRGCVAAQVDTLSFQAPMFYQKLGFKTVGKITGFSEHPERYFLLKHY